MSDPFTNGPEMNNSPNRSVTLVLVGWLCFAIGLAGWFRNASAATVAATVWTLTALVLLACWKIAPIRVWTLNVDLRWLVSFHFTRLVAGAYFLVLCGRGELPCGFAMRAGWGDIIVAVLALPVVALRCGLADWQSMHALRELPLSLLPTFLVPLIIASHVLIFFRMARAGNIT